MVFSAYTKYFQGSKIISIKIITESIKTRGLCPRPTPRPHHKFEDFWTSMLDDISTRQKKQFLKTSSKFVEWERLANFKLIFKEIFPTNFSKNVKKSDFFLPQNWKVMNLDLHIKRNILEKRWSESVYWERKAGELS